MHATLPLWLSALGLVTLAGPAAAQDKQPPAAPVANAPGSPANNRDKNVIAEVNGQLITRQELADELIARKGKKELELLINRRIIDHACQKAGVTATDAEVEDELRGMVRGGGFASVGDFERTMLLPRQTTLAEYKEDILRKGLLMRKLAGSRVAVTEEDLRHAYESRYGEKVQCRIILVKDPKAAMKLHAQIAGDPARFLSGARQQEDRTLAASAGQINPVGRYMTHDIIEKRAFQLQDGEVSEVLQTPEGGCVILLREKLLPAETGKAFEEVRDQLRADVTERKTQELVPKLFNELKTQATVRNYLDGKTDINSILQKYEQQFGLPK